MHRTGIAMATVVVLLLASAGATAQPTDPPLVNWSAPPYWNPAVHTRVEGEPEGGMQAQIQELQAQAEALPSSPLPFVAIAPCRIVDTRVAVSDGFHQPNFIDNETRTFDLPTSPDCTGLPSTTGAWSLNVQFRPISTASYITLFPTGTTRPGVSTIVATPAGFTTDAAIVPAGTGGAIDVYCQYAGRVVIDINGYYGPQSVVTSLNTQTGDLTLAAGSNVTITPSANTLTIAATGGPGGELPAGSASQTLRSNGSAWLASSVLTNDGTNVGISGNIALPSTGTGGLTGVLMLGGNRFLHNWGVGNTFVGQQAGNFTMPGSFNTATGYQSLSSNTTGWGNTAIGDQSLVLNTTGSFNIAIGDQSLVLNTTGSFNTATGSHSLYVNTTGDNNTASGYQSLSSNTTGSYNAASGQGSLASNTVGAYNTANGYVSLYSNTTGIYNAATGAGSLYSNTTGSWNTASGVEGLHANTIGSYNAASGYRSLYSNTTANRNTAIGNSALFVQSFDNAGTPWDSANTAVGDSALYSNQPTSTSDGIRNTALGVSSLFAGTTGFENTAAGFSALYAVTTGWYNTAVGSNAGNRSDTINGYGGGTATFVPSTAGSYNTFLGRGTGAAADVNNCTAVGVDAYCTADNQVRLGNFYVNSIGGEVAWSALSDLRAKTDVRDLDLGLDFVIALRPVAYTLRSGNGKTDMGFVAQDIEALLGDGYNVLDIGGDPERTLSLRHTDLIAPLVKAIQEQQAQLAVKDARIAALERLEAAHQAEIDTLMEQQAQFQELRRQVKMLVAARSARPDGR